MGENDYTKREIDYMFAEIHEKLDLLLAQTTLTNGRVTKLESWKDRMVGGVAVLVALVLPVLIYVAQQWF